MKNMEADNQKLKQRIQELEAENTALKAQKNRTMQYSEVFLHFFEESEDPISICELDGGIYSINRAFQRITGWTAAECQDIELFSLIHQDDIDRLKHLFRESIGGQNSNPQEFRLRAKSGYYLTINIRVFPYLEGNEVKAVWCAGKDITEYKRTDKALKRSQSYLYSILNNAPFPIYIISKNSHLLSANLLCDQTLGFAISRMQGQKLDSIFSAKISNELKIANEQVIKSMMPASVEAQLELSGILRHFLIQKFPLVNGAGECEAIGNIMLDITDIKSQEEASRLKAEYLSGLVGLTNAAAIARLTFEHIRKSYPCDSGIILTKKGSADCQVEILYSFDTFANGQLQAEEAREVWSLDQSSYSAGVLETGNPIIINRTEEEAARIIPTMANTLAFNNRPSRTIAYIPLKIHGQVIGVISIQTYHPNAYPPQLIRAFESIAADAALAITAARGTEAIEESENRFRVLFENAPDIIYFTDLKGTILDANRAAERAIQLDKKDWIGKNISELRLANPGEKQKIEEGFVKLCDGTEFGPETFSIIRSDGQEVLLEARAYPVKIKDQVVVMGIARDIGERIKAEEALRQSEERFAVAFKASPAALSLTRVDDGSFIAVNDSFIAITGYCREELMGKTSVELGLYPNPRLRNEFVHVISQNGVIKNYELEIRAKAGEIKNVLFSTEVVELNNERLLLATMVDITERKLAEKALIRSEYISRALHAAFVKMNKCASINETVETLLEAALDISGLEGGGIYLIENNVALLCTYSNLPDSFIEKVKSVPLDLAFVKKVSNSDVTPKSITELPELREFCANYGLKHAYSLPLKTSDGQPLGFMNLATTQNTEPDKANLNALAILAQEAETLFLRIKTEQELQASETRYRRIVENATEGIWALDRDLNTSFVNPKMASILGFTPEEMVGEPVAEFIFPDDLDDHRLHMELRRGGGDDNYYRQFRCKDGSGRWCNVSATSLKDSNGEFSGTFAMFTDITERRNMEIALAESERKFREMAEQINDVLFVANAEGIITYVSPSCESIFGWHPNEMMDKQFDMVIHEPKSILSAERYPEAFKNLELSMKRKDGSIFSGELNGSIRLKDNRFAGVIGLIRDISQRKLAEKALREREYKLSSIFRAAPVGIGVVVDRVIIEANERLSIMTGYSREELINMPSRVLYPTDEDYNYVGVEKYRQIQEYGIGSVETRWKRKDETIIEILLSSCPINISDHSQGVTFSALDISERNRAERELRESEERFRSLVETAPDGIIIQAQGQFTYANNEALRIFGASSLEQLIGKGVIGYFHPNCRQQIRDRIHRLNEEFESVPLLEELILREDGTTIPVEASAIPFAFEGSQGALVFLRDITERKCSEEALKRLAIAVEQSADGILITDTQGVIQYVNPAFETIAGFSREEAVGQSTRIMKGDKQDKQYYENMWKTLLTGETWSGQLINKRKDGSSYNEILTISPVLDASGKLINYVAIMRDVTRQVTLEQMFNQSQKMEAVGRLAGGVAHDFNNLLTAIMGYSEFLLNKIPEDSPLYADVDEIKKAGERAADLTRQLLAFSRKQMIQPKVLILNNIVSEMNKMLKRLIGEDVELIIMPSDSPWQVKADPGQIEQVIMNLAINARDAMPDGGKLIIETANLKIKNNAKTPIPGMKGGDFVMLAIHDSGTGISSEIKAHIFEPFFTTKERGKGTGLGLATVYAIVEQNEGYIECDSEPGRGTSFKIYLPKQIIPVGRIQASAIPNQIADGSETILVVEDEEIVRNLACRVLREAGYNILAASGPMEAIQICESYQNKIHLVLTDVIMPVMNGIALIEQLQAKYPQLKSILMTGYMDSSFIDDQSDSCMDIIQKPFKKDILLSKIRDIIEGVSERTKQEPLSNIPAD